MLSLYPFYFDRNAFLLPFCIHDCGAWLRLWEDGPGIGILDRVKFPPLFSVRNGLVKEYRLGRWGVRFLGVSRRRCPTPQKHYPSDVLGVPVEVTVRSDSVTVAPYDQAPHHEQGVTHIPPRPFMKKP